MHVHANQVYVKKNLYESMQGNSQAITTTTSYHELHVKEKIVLK